MNALAFIALVLLVCVLGLVVRAALSMRGRMRDPYDFFSGE